MNLRMFCGLLAIAAFAVVSGQSRAATPTLTTLVSFNGSDGQGPRAPLIADASGNLFGTTVAGGAYGGLNGTVFEIVKTASGYANSPTTLVNFNGTNGAFVTGGLIMDANGNLFGTTTYGGAYGEPCGCAYGGTVFEIAKTGNGYARTLTILVNFN
jgi:hypothetical protein